MAKCKIGCDFIPEGDCCITCNYGKELDSYDAAGVLYSRRGYAQTSINCSGSCSLLRGFPNGFAHTDCDKCSTYDTGKYQFYAVPEPIYNLFLKAANIKHQKVGAKQANIIIYVNPELQDVKRFIAKHKLTQIDKKTMMSVVV